jgi:CRP/FNR family transcriptional regulator, anaerobic regulatory protein
MITVIHRSQAMPAAGNCLDCRMRHRCITGTLDDTDTLRIGQLVERRRTLPRGRRLYLAGTPSRARIYALRQGDVKIVQENADGSQFIDRFHHPGDIVGLDTIGMANHTNSAVTLNTVELCELPFATLQQLASTHLALRAILIGLMQRQLQRQRAITLLLHNNNAQQRLLGALLGLPSARQRDGEESLQLKLPMSRQDMADHLGIGRATISRLLAQMQSQGLLQVKGRLLTFPRAAALAAASGQCHPLARPEK